MTYELFMQYSNAKNRWRYFKNGHMLKREPISIFNNIPVEHLETFKKSSFYNAKCHRIVYRGPREKHVKHFIRGMIGTSKSFTYKKDATAFSVYFKTNY